MGQEGAVRTVASSMPVFMQMRKVKSGILRSLGRLQAEIPKI